MSIPTPENQRDYRRALGGFATGITVVTTQVGEITHGMTCNAFMSISLDPPLIGVCVTHKAKMHDYLKESQRFGVSILAADQEHLSSHFAGRPQEEPIPFVDIESMPLIDGANVHFIAKVVEQPVIGDHTLFVGQVTYYAHVPDTDPLLYFGGRYATLQ